MAKARDIGAARLFKMGVLPQQQRTGAVFLPAPVGGINTISPAGAMPPSDCIAMKNLIPFQYGLRVRSGFRDWFVGIRYEEPDGSMAFDTVKTVIPFTGSAENGAKDRLFAVTMHGIYDVTDRQMDLTVLDPTPVFGPSDGWTVNSRAGTGAYTAFTNAAGEHFLAYTDGANGYMLYRESTGDWIKIVEGSGTDGLSISGANPGSFRFVMQWKNRLWFVPGNSTKSYYLDVRQYAGTAYELNFAPRFKYGGNLTGLWSWTLDGGQGIDDLLVGISRAGDVVVYQGTDPATPGAFGLKGVWWVGPVPPGRNIASDFGGDLFVLSMAGCLPMSKLVAGGLIRDPNIYETAKVANLFNKLMSERGTIPGWALTQHPTDNLLVINVPGLAGGPPEQLVMSLATKGWAEQTGIPIQSMTTWHGALFFGTSDGRVCQNVGYFDSGVSVVESGGEVPEQQYVDSGPQPINFGLLTSFQNGGSPKKKRVHMARPYFTTDGTQPGYSLQARYDYLLSPVDLAATTARDATQSPWDTATWDSSLWGSGYGISGRQFGTTGLGTAVAMVLTGTVITDTTYVGMDVLLEEGGLL